MWDTVTGDIVRTLTGHTNQIHDISFNATGTLLLSASCGSQEDNSRCAEGQVILWDVAAGTALRIFNNHNGDIYEVEYHPSGDFFATASADTNIILWRMDTLSDLIGWVYSNRAVRDLTCQEQIRFQLETLCESETDESSAVNE